MVHSPTFLPSFLTSSRSRLLFSAVAGLLFATSANAQARKSPTKLPTTQRFALVIGSNATLNAQQSPLRFADDDAARMAELLREQGVVTTLVTEFDQESQAQFPELVKTARPANHESVMAAHRAQVARMQRATSQGPVEYMIYYSGHGDIGPDGQGFLTLTGQTKLTRHDLFTELLGSSPADYNHIIVDACRSEEFVLSRGDRQDWKPDRTEADYSQAVTDYLAKQHLGHFPNTGVVLASSVDQQTHEWAHYRGGVFTHELLSGMRGAADINGDGVVEYSELGAFVSAANSGVRDPRAKLRVVVRPPRTDERHGLVNLGKLGEKRVLLFDGGDTAKYSLEDARGVRLADVRRSGDRPGYVRLPAGMIYVSRETPGSKATSESKIAPDQNKVVLASSLGFSASTRAARGALDVAFREGLFAVPYGYGYYAGYTSRQGMLAIDEPDWEVKVYREVDGDMVEVADTTEGPKPAKTRAKPHDDDDDDDDFDFEDWVPHEVWGGFSVGTVFTTFRAEDRIKLTDADQEFDTNQLQPWASPLRGIDVRWQTFTLGRRKYPVWMGYFRTGYTRGSTTFSPQDSENGFVFSNATAMNYYAVPLFFGCNLYLFNDFPVRPFAGLGFGFDIVHMQYARHNRDILSDVRAKIGFELHTGVEARITNYVALRGEIQQLWSARNRFDDVPNFRNSGFTIVTSLAFSLPYKRRNAKMAERRKRREARRERERQARRQQEERIRVEIRRGEERVVIDTQPAPAAPAKPAAPTAPTTTVAPTTAPTPAPTPAQLPPPSGDALQMQPPK